MVERDAFPVSDVPRKGVPQRRHAHGLRARGRNVIEALFPGWTDEVVASGGIRGDVNWIGHGALKSARSDLIGLLASRPLLEGHVRRRLLKLANVRAIENCAVQGLVASDDNSAIKGVRVRVGNGAEQTILADLVVDASGRGSASPAWLESFGYARPEEEKIEIGIGYTTRVFRRRPTDLGGKLAIGVAGRGPNCTMLFQTEERWIVSIGGYFGDDAPGDPQMFAAHAGSLPAPEIHDIVAHAEPLTDFVSYRYSANRRRSLRAADALSEKLSRVRRRRVQLQSGHDGGCAGSRLAGRMPRRGVADLALRFFNLATTAIDTPWDITVGNDLRHPQVQGPRSPKIRFINGYIGKLHMAARDDGALATAFLEVANLQARPERLLHPAIVLRVIWGNLFRRGSYLAKAAQVS